jgi:hypothetical protein
MSALTSSPDVGIERDLTGTEDEVARRDRLAVRADAFGALSVDTLRRSIRYFSPSRARR